MNKYSPPKINITPIELNDVITNSLTAEDLFAPFDNVIHAPPTWFD